MTNCSNTPRPVQDWENKDVKGMALCCDSLFDEYLEKVTKLREQQAAYEDSLPTKVDDAFRGINKALPCLDGIGEQDYGLRAALRIYNMLFSKGEPLDDTDIDALYWLNCQTEDALYRIERGNTRARDIALKQIDKSREQVAQVSEAMDAMEPEVAEGMRAMLKAVVGHGIPMEEAIAVFNEVVDEHQGKSAA